MEEKKRPQKVNLEYKKEEDLQKRSIVFLDRLIGP